MIIEKKENYTLIIADENSFTEFFSKFSDALTTVSTVSIFVQLSDKINSTQQNISLFLKVAETYKNNGMTFVIICSDIAIDAFPEYLNIVPTLIEAEDILEMENIERELGL